jgi:hypothetical protein
MNKKIDLGIRSIRRSWAAVCKVTGIIVVSEEATGSRKRDYVFARMLFAWQCNRLGVSKTRIAELLHTSTQSVARYLRKFDDECKYNVAFKALADEVEKEMERYRDSNRRKKDYINRWEKAQEASK